MRHARQATLDDYATLVEKAFGVTVHDRRPELATTPEDEDAMDSLLGGLAPLSAHTEPGREPSRQAMAGASVRSLRRPWREERPGTILVNGSPGETTLVQEVVEAARPA